MKDIIWTKHTYPHINLIMYTCSDRSREYFISPIHGKKLPRNHVIQMVWLSIRLREGSQSNPSPAI